MVKRYKCVQRAHTDTDTQTHSLYSTLSFSNLCLALVWSIFGFPAFAFTFAFSVDVCVCVCLHYHFTRFGVALLLKSILYNLLSFPFSSVPFRLLTRTHLPLSIGVAFTLASFSHLCVWSATTLSQQGTPSYHHHSPIIIAHTNP